MEPNKYLKKPGLIAGAITGLTLTAPLTAILYFVGRVTGLAFAPFQAFDWVRDRLPAGLINAGIEGLAKFLSALGMSVRQTAKPAEIMLVTGTFIGAAAVAAAIFFVIARRLPKARLDLGGIILGLIFGLPLAAIVALPRGLMTPFSALGAAWTLAAFLIWGYAQARVWAALAGFRGAESSSPAGEAKVWRISRRRFVISLGAASALITVSGTLLGRFLSKRTGVSGNAGRIAPIPSEAAPGVPEIPGRFEASLAPAAGTRPELTPVKDHYRIDINLEPPTIDGDRWSLMIGGLVQAPVTLTLNDFITKYEPLHQSITLSCISNSVGGDLIGTTRWTGVSLKRLLAQTGIKEGAKYLELGSADGFHETIPLDLILGDERIMFTYAWDGKPLPVEHGFPLRIYIPDRYGMKQPKWITRAEVVADRREGYWVERGWDREARARATSVIDTVAVKSLERSADGRALVPIGGIAWAGARGISRVEVRVDEGAWEPARLKRPLSGTTWLIWRHDWPFEAGSHAFTVRCIESDGTPQIETPADTFPSGATGFHRVRKEIAP